MEKKGNELDKNDPIDEKKIRKQLREKQNKQIMWAVILMALVILIILGNPYIINNYFNKFDYKGLVFQKTKLGEIEFYSTYVPLTNTKPVTGNLIAEDQITSTYSLNLRSDPRESEDIKVDLDINNITFIKKATVYVSFDSNDPPCQHNVISTVELARFLMDFGGFNVEGAVVNKDYAEENNIPWITCEARPGNTVILVKAGSENKISEIRDNCYEIMYKECDVLPVSEKFILVVLEGYMNYFEKK